MYVGNQRLWLYPRCPIVMNSYREKHVLENIMCIAIVHLYKHINDKWLKHNIWYDGGTKKHNQARWPPFIHSLFMDFLAISRRVDTHYVEFVWWGKWHWYFWRAWYILVASSRSVWMVVGSPCRLWYLILRCTSESTTYSMTEKGRSKM